MIEAVLFDLDGTLLNTMTDIINSVNYALSELGLPTHTEEAGHAFIGHGRVFLVTSALGEYYTEERFEKALAMQDAYYKAHSEDFTCPYEGVVELVEKLKASGIKTAIVSNKPDHFCKELAPRYFGDAMDPVFGNVEGAPVKPDPYLLQKALDALGVAPEHAVYVGDSGLDMITAKHCRMTGCGVSWGFQTKEKLVSGGADFLCNTAKDLEDAIFINQNEYIYKTEDMTLCAVRGADEVEFVQWMGKSTEEYYEDFEGTSLYAIKEDEKLVCFAEVNPMDVEEIALIFMDEEPADECFVKIQELIEGFLATMEY